jgi:hypothetical protein
MNLFENHTDVRAVLELAGNTIDSGKRGSQMQQLDGRVAACLGRAGCWADLDTIPTGVLSELDYLSSNRDRLGDNRSRLGDNGNRLGGHCNTLLVVLWSPHGHMKLTAIRQKSGL